MHDTQTGRKGRKRGFYSMGLMTSPLAGTRRRDYVQVHYVSRGGAVVPRPAAK